MTALYVLGAILVVLVLAVMVAPLFREEGPAAELESLPPAERREAALEAVRDLQFEHETGKMGDDEYRRLRAHYGRIVLAAEEELETAGEAVPEGGGEARAAVAAAREGDAGGEAAREAGSGAESPGPVPDCPECGAELEAAVRFCPSCGARQPAASAEEREG